MSGMVQPFLKEDGGGYFIHFRLSFRAGKVAFQQGIFSGNCGEAFILKEHGESGFFKLGTEITDLFCLKSFRTIHIERQAGKNLRCLIAVTDGFDGTGIRSPSDTGNHLYRRSNGTGGVGYCDTDADISDVQGYDSFIHTFCKKASGKKTRRPMFFY